MVPSLRVSPDEKREKRAWWNPGQLDPLHSRLILLMAEIWRSPPGMYETLKNNKINYQKKLASRISAINSMKLKDAMQQQHRGFFYDVPSGLWPVWHNSTLPSSTIAQHGTCGYSWISLGYHVPPPATTQSYLTCSNLQLWHCQRFVPLTKRMKGTVPVGQNKGNVEILLMEEIPNNHLGCIKKTCKQWDIYHINWLAGFLNHQPHQS